MLLWRITDYADLTGIGGQLADGRWHNRGRAIIYTAESSAGALNEMLVHMDRASLAPTFQLACIEVPSDTNMRSVKGLDSNWQKNLALTRTIGDKWLAEKTELLLRVPSAIIPHSFNVLVNPAHPDIVKTSVKEIRFVGLDERLR